MGIPRNSLIWLAAIAGATFALSLVGTLLTRTVARRVGFVAKPRAERWHGKPTAMAGGIAIWVSFAVGSLVVAGPARTVLICGSAMFVLGLVDDVFHLKPYAKLIGQVVIAAFAVLSGPVLPWTSVPLLDHAFSFFWLIGITNAINLLDNMDGLAGGVALIASLFQTIFFLLQHQLPEAGCAAALTGAVAGFLVWNWKPATIFMGDCGALFLGYTLAALSMQSTYGRSRGLLATIAAPVLVMLVPIFDTTFVTLVRVVRGRRVSEGGRDHTSHRLVTLGMSERVAVTVLLVLGLLGGSIAVLARLGFNIGIWIGVPVVALMLVFVGIHLARTDKPVEGPDRVNLLSSFAAFGYRRRIFEVLLDAGIAMFSFVSAFLLRFDGDVPGQVQETVTKVFLVVVAVKLAALYVTHAYDGLWRYAGVRDLLRLGRGATLGAIAVVVILSLWTQFRSLSRGALIIDAIVFAALLMASRVSFRLLRLLIGRPPQAPSDGTRVLLWGAGDLGELLARRLVEQMAEGLVPIGFVDDDPLKSGRLIHGLPVHGGSDEIAGLIQRGLASLVVVTSPRISADRIAAVAAVVGAERVTRPRLLLEQVGPASSSRSDAVRLTSAPVP